MRLSVFDCSARGIANLRGNWELVLLQMGQMGLFLLLAVVLAVGFVAATGATFLLQMGSPEEWSRALERVGALDLGGGLLAIAGAATLIAVTLGALLWAWFQAGIFSTLESGERQAPPSPRTEWTAFRTFRWRAFRGWGGRWVWRYLGFLLWFLLVATAVLGAVILALALCAAFLPRQSVGAAAALGCVAVFPLLAALLSLNLWLVVAQAILPRSEQGVLRASRAAWTVLRRRPGAAVILLLFFLLASAGVSVVFWPLSQGMAMAVDNALAALVVELLLGTAQMLVASILTIAFYGSMVALARSELARQAA